MRVLVSRYGVNTTKSWWIDAISSIEGLRQTEVLIYYERSIQNINTIYHFRLQPT